MKALVTGADGLLGANLVRELLGQGDTVRAFIQPGSRSSALDGLSLERVEGDLTEGSAALAEAMQGCDAAFHCAAITDQWAPSDLHWKVNFEGTRAILDACLAAKIKRLVFVGSASSFKPGTIETPADETAPFPEAYKGMAYMESKHKAMNLVKEYVRDRGLDAVIVAPTFMIGPYDARPSSGELIRQFIKRNIRFASPGGRNFAHARDAARAASAALEKGRAGECYILGGRNLSYLEFFTMVAREVGRQPPKLVLPRGAILFGGALGSLFEKMTGRKALVNMGMARLSLMYTYYSPQKAIQELGMPRTPIGDAIRECIESLKKYGHLGE